MKNRAKELDVDFIGGQNTPLTKAEAKAISDFIQAEKEKRKLKAPKKENKPQKKQVV